MPDLAGAIPIIGQIPTFPGLPLFELQRRAWQAKPSAPVEPVLSRPAADVPVTPRVTMARLRQATLHMVELKPFGLLRSIGYRLRRRVGWPDPDNDLIETPKAILLLELLIPALAFVAILWCALSLAQFSDVQRGWQVEQGDRPPVEHSMRR